MIDIDVMDNLGLKIVKYDSLSACIIILRKYRNDSMSDIKKDIETNDFIFACDYIDDDELLEMIKCYDELVDAGCSVEIYDLGRIGSRELLCNLHESHVQIAKEVEEEIDAEVGDDEDIQ